MREQGMTMEEILPVARGSSPAAGACQTGGTRPYAKTYPLVTLALPTVNGTGYFRETLACVLSQDYPNLEILVSVNNSPCGISGELQEMIQGDRRVRFRSNPSTVPMNEHFSQCLADARGEYFVLLCDDDLINPIFVSELVDVALRHQDLKVVVPANSTIDETGNVIKEYATPDGEVFDGPEFVCRWLRGPGPGLFANITTVLGRTELMRHFGGFRGFARGQNTDNLIFLQCAITGRVGFAHRAVFNCRVYDHSYGAASRPEHVAESSYQFLQNLLRDPPTVSALTSLPKALRKEIINGVRIMTAREFLSRIHFFEHPFRMDCLRKLLLFHWDFVFYRVVLRWYCSFVWRRCVSEKRIPANR